MSTKTIYSLDEDEAQKQQTVASVFSLLVFGGSHMSSFSSRAAVLSSLDGAVAELLISSLRREALPRDAANRSSSMIYSNRVGSKVDGAGGLWREGLSGAGFISRNSHGSSGV